MPSTASNPKLNEAQLMLLQLFSREISPEAMSKLKRLLIDFYDDIVQSEIIKLQNEKNLTQVDLDKLKTTHPKRKPYES